MFATAYIGRGETASTLVFPALLVTLAFLVIASLWVPIDFKLSGRYYDADLFKTLAPRALLGTIAKILQLGPEAYIFVRQLFQALWLFLIVVEIFKSVSPQTKSDLVAVVTLSFLFAFNTVVYTTNGLAEFIDVVPYSLILSAAIIFMPRNGQLTSIRYFSANLLLLAAVMVHEKSLFDLSILAVWLTWKGGLKRSAILLLPSFVGAFSFLWLVSANNIQGQSLAPLDYIGLIPAAVTYVLEESFNIWGVFLAGGMLWVVFVAAAHKFVNSAAVEKGSRIAVVVAMLIICFSTLLVACDTIRMVGLIWLPTFLLIREIDLKSALDSMRFRSWGVPACLVQILLPPLLMYQNGVAPFNCYSRELLRLVPHQSSITTVTMSAHDGLIPAVGPFKLYALDRTNISDTIICWPPRPFRMEKPTRAD